MPTEIQSISRNGSHLEIIFVGECTGDNYLQFAPQILSAIKSHSCQKLLFDFSQVAYRTKILVEHAFAEFLGREFPCGTTFAMIVPAGEKKCFAHLETAARNRGTQVHVFLTRDEAMNFLTYFAGNREKI